MATEQIILLLRKSTTDVNEALKLPLFQSGTLVLCIKGRLHPSIKMLPTAGT